jgi:Aerotolerance regulator N-terminal/von Willebrand factor type A domain
MPFLLSHSAATWLLPAITLPILFHLFFRLLRQVREFPSLMFFLRIDPRLSAKRKIHEWLILLLRTLFILLLVLALARPLLGLKGANENVARLILIDNSGSMAGLTKGGISKLTLAQRAAAKLIAAARPGDSTAVQLMIPDPTAPLPHGFDATAAVLSEAIDKLTPSDGAPSIPKAIRLALATLDTAKATQRELDIITDLQQKNWTRGDVGAESTVACVIIHRIESSPLTAGSVSLEAVEVPARAIPVGRVTPVRVALRNQGPGAAHVRINSADDSGKNFTKDVQIAPGITTPVSLTFSFANRGFHWAQTWVEGDAATSCNRAEFGFWTTDVQKVLFVGGKDDFAAMPYAISPGGNPDLSGIDTIFTGGDPLGASLAAKPLAVVATWDKWPQDGATSEALLDYVRHGGTLFLAPAPDSGVAISKPSAIWLDASAGALVTPKDPEPVVLLQDGDALWRDLRDSDGRPKLGLLRVLQYRPIKTGSDWQILISSAQGATLLARHDVGQGHVYVSGLAFSPKWSSLPLKGAFVVLMQNAVFGDQAEHIPVQEIHAGEEFHFDFPDAQAAIKSLAGSALDWHGEARDFEGLPRAGIYQVSQRDHINWIATSGNVDEADPHFLPRAQVSLLRNLPHEVVPLIHEDDVIQTALSHGSGTSLYRWLMLTALLVLLAETWLANERSSDLGKKLFDSLAPSASKKTSLKKPPELAKV